MASPAAYAFTSPSRVFFADARSAIVARPSLWKQTQLCGQTGLSPADDDLDPHEGSGQNEQRTITMTRSRILATLVALLALAGTASARIQDYLSAGEKPLPTMYMFAFFTFAAEKM